MITVIVTFKLPKPVTRNEAADIFRSTAPRYRDMDGLVRKYYIVAEDGATAGGVYLWRSRAQADAVYSGEWKELVRAKYGSEPNVTYMESPVIVDNLTKEILED